jgi:hypothetical protein
MPKAFVSNEDLIRHINKGTTRLAKLEQITKNKKAFLADLTRYAELLTPTAAQPATVSAAADKKLSQLLVDILRQANRPLTTKQLAMEVVRSKYPTKTRNVTALVKSLVNDLVKTGVLRRAAGQPGVILDQATTAAKTTRGTSGRPAKLCKPTKLGRPAKPKPAEPREKQTLAALLAQLLAKSSRPLKARELADQAKASGYKSKSRDFTSVIWVVVSKLAGVENVPGEGYRLKR